MAKNEYKHKNDKRRRHCPWKFSLIAEILNFDIPKSEALTSKGMASLPVSCTYNWYTKNKGFFAYNLLFLAEILNSLFVEISNT